MRAQRVLPYSRTFIFMLVSLSALALSYETLPGGQPALAGRPQCPDGSVPPCSKPKPTPTPVTTTPAAKPTPTPRANTRRRHTPRRHRRYYPVTEPDDPPPSADANKRASDMYESYRPKSEGSSLDCEETGEERLVRGERHVSVPADGCTGWFIMNPDPENPTFTRSWRWQPDGEVLVEVEDRGGYGAYTESPTRNLILHGNRTKGVRFKGLGKPVTVTFWVDIKFVVRLRNDTNGPIPYQLRHDGVSESFTIQPNTILTHTLVAVSCCTVEYDYKYESGRQEKRYSLDVLTVPDHDPTEEEKKTAPIYYFKVKADGDIELYAER